MSDPIAPNGRGAIPAGVIGAAISYGIVSVTTLPTLYETGIVIVLTVLISILGNELEYQYLRRNATNKNN